jgi:5'-phosphate synthase pdxT subunit
VKKGMTIGVLALQGAFREHVQVLQRLGVKAVEVRTPEELDTCQGLVLPGGETTTQRKLAKRYGLWEPLRKRGRNGFPILATCAGLILLAKKVEDHKSVSQGERLNARKDEKSTEEPSLDILDIDVVRNAYGRQVHSFEAPLEITIPGTASCMDATFPAVFIRAPRITRVGRDVFNLSTWKGEPVAVEQGNIFGLTFHPELTTDDRFHRYFLERVEQEQKRGKEEDSQVSRMSSNVSLKSLNL